MADKVSLRRVRQATGETIANVRAQAEAIEHLGTDLGTLAGLVGQHAVTLDGHIQQLAALPRPETGFWGRLRWLVTGR